MHDATKKKIRRATVIYWLLLTYIVAALVWWFISLEKQNSQMRDLELTQLKSTIDSASSPVIYNSKAKSIHKEYNRNKIKYISEGSVFLILLLVGAGFVYRAVRREFRLHRQQQNFMMAVTHELKTPISVARLNLETLLKYSLDPEKQRKLIHNALKETSRLNSLTNNILIASQLEGDSYRSPKEELDLSDLLKDCLQGFRNNFPERIFAEHAEPDVELKGDPLLLQMLINNLLENAVKYSPKESKISTSLQKENGVVRLEIADEGPGIPDEEKKKIFSKFYRIGNESTRKSQGTGLGLYLCSKIAHDHNADILVTNNTAGGSTFAIIFRLRNK